MKIATSANDLLSVGNQRLSADRRDFKVLFAVTFVMFLVVFALARLLPRSWRPRAASNGRRKGVIQQARAEANLLASCALMH